MNEIKTFAIFLISCIISCNYVTEKKSTEQENTIISKVKYKKDKNGTDTLWVSQNDSAVFKQEEVIVNRPCSDPELQIRYELIKPENNAYYFIYNNKKQLVIEGKYTDEYTYEGQTYKNGAFYNSKSYSYKRNGNMSTIHYMEDGRNSKVESFDNKKRLTEIIYFDKKSSDKEKVENYNKGKLEETRIYTSFDNYYTEKAN